MNPLQHFIFPANENPFTIQNISAVVADTTDQLILQAIIHSAQEDGITDLYLMDKQFVADAIREALEHRWIPVTDHLPKNDYGTHWKEREYYLVRLSNGTMRVAHYGYKEYDWWIDSHDCVLSEKHYTEVTHWRHLPAQPKEV